MGKTIGKIVLAAVGLVVVASMVLVVWHSGQILREMAEVRVEPDVAWSEAEAAVVEALDLGRHNGIDLHAWMLSAEEPEGVIVFLHGLHGMDAASMVRFAFPLWEAGYTVFCLDMRAHGQSGGSEIGMAYTEPQDIKVLLDWIAEQPTYGELTVSLIGYSMGGAAAISTAAQRPDVAGVVSISGFASFEETFVDALRQQEVPEPITYLYRWGVRINLWRRYGARPTAAAPLISVTQLSETPLLLVHGSADEQIDVRQAQMLYAAAPAAELWLLPAAGHDAIITLFSDPEHRERLLQFLQQVHG